MNKILILCVFGFFVSMILPARAFSQISQQESEIINIAAAALEHLCNCAQAGYKSRGPYGGSTYPGRELCGGSERTCWNSSSIVGSTNDLKHTLEEFCTDIAEVLHITPDIGDVRFRCRYQKGQTYCFAYRCFQAEPSGCQQAWRLERDNVGESGRMKCVNLDPDPRNDYCSLLVPLVEIECPAGCRP